MKYTTTTFAKLIVPDVLQKIRSLTKRNQNGVQNGKPNRNEPGDEHSHSPGDERGNKAGNEPGNERGNRPGNESVIGFVHTPHPFGVMVRKEVGDHVRSWRFIVIASLIVFTCFASLYTGVTNMKAAVQASESDDFFFLFLFTATDGTVPSYMVFVSFLAPLLGISLGFDAINSEQNGGRLSRLLAQPIHRDYVLNAKFAGALLVIGMMLFALGFLVMGAGLIRVGIPPSAEEFWRVVFFTIISVLYVGFWLNLAILFSVLFRQPATSALCSIAVWLFFTVFFSLIVNVIAKASSPSVLSSEKQIHAYERFVFGLTRLAPSQLYSDATTTLLVPSVRSIGPLSMERIHGAIPGPVSLGQSLLVVWPQLTGLLAATILCFGLSYWAFMRREIRSR